MSGAVRDRNIQVEQERPLVRTISVQVFGNLIWGKYAQGDNLGPTSDSDTFRMHEGLLRLCTGRVQRDLMLNYCASGFGGVCSGSSYKSLRLAGVPLSRL